MCHLWGLSTKKRIRGLSAPLEVLNEAVAWGGFVMLSIDADICVCTFNGEHAQPANAVTDFYGFTAMAACQKKACFSGSSCDSISALDPAKAGDVRDDAVSWQVEGSDNSFDFVASGEVIFALRHGTWGG